MSKCKCDFRTKMVGDGCEVCNPAKALQYARETIQEQADRITALESTLRQAREWIDAQPHPRMIGANDALAAIDAVLAPVLES